MVYDGSDMLEEPLVGTFVNVVDIITGRPAKITPASRDNRSDSGRCDRLEHFGAERFWIVHDNTAEADVDWRRTALKERLELGWWGVAGRVAEEEATDV